MITAFEDFQLMTIYMYGEKRPGNCIYSSEYPLEEILNYLEAEDYIIQHRDTDQIELTAKGMERVKKITPIVI